MALLFDASGIDHIFQTSAWPIMAPAPWLPRRCRVSAGVLDSVRWRLRLARVRAPMGELRASRAHLERKVRTAARGAQHMCTPRGRSTKIPCGPLANTRLRAARASRGPARKREEEGGRRGRSRSTHARSRRVDDRRGWRLLERGGQATAPGPRETSSPSPTTPSLPTTSSVCR